MTKERLRLECDSPLAPRCEATPVTGSERERQQSVKSLLCRADR